MPFSESIKDEIYRNSGGQCECRRDHAKHRGRRCPVTFTRNGGQWDANHKPAERVGGQSVASNGEALCVECHRLTASYGRS